MYVVTWTHFEIVGLTSGYLAFVLIMTLGSSPILGGMYIGNRVTNPDPNALTTWVYFLFLDDCEEPPAINNESA